MKKIFFCKIVLHQMRKASQNDKWYTKKKNKWSVVTSLLIREHYQLIQKK